MAKVTKPGDNYAHRVPDDHIGRDLWVYLLDQQSHVTRSMGKRSAKQRREHSRKLRRTWAIEPPSNTPTQVADTDEIA